MKRTKFITPSLILSFLLALTFKVLAETNASFLKSDSLIEKISKANMKQKQDYSRTRSVVFNRNASFLGRLSKDQKEIISLEGLPDYNRTFRTLLHGKLVKEWIYLDKNYLMQFVDGKLVYVGPIDDKERIIIHYGQPTFIRTRELMNGRLEIFFYKARGLMFVFSNDKLVKGVPSGL